MQNRKRFFTYEEQIALLKSKKLTIADDSAAIEYLKKFGYYYLISGYKDVFKVEKNGDYRQDSCFERYNAYYSHEILSQMGFPDNWEEILTK